MSEIKKLSSDNEQKVAGGAMINGELKVLLEESEVKKREYICKSCHRSSYKTGNSLERCPYCGKFFGYSLKPRWHYLTMIM